MQSDPRKTEAATPLRLKLMGAFALTDATGRDILVSSRKNRALLAILALSPDMSCARDKLAELLWGDFPEASARSSLRQSLAVLRKELAVGGNNVLEASDDSVMLKAEGVTCDAGALLAASESRDIDTLRRAARGWHPDLLDDVAVREPAFETWLASQRHRLQLAAAAVFEKLAELETGQPRIKAAESLIAIDPLSESSHRVLMRIHSEAGDKGLALKQFELCARLLRDELQVDPSPETRSLRDEIARGLPAGSPAIHPSRAGHQRPAIAVLPFENTSPDPDERYISDGIAEDTIASLSRFHRLTVIARSSSFGYRHARLSAAEAGRKLGVPFVVHGSVRRANNRVRLTVELVSSHSEAVIWAGTFDRDAGGVFSLIDELSAEIVASTVGRIEDELLRQSQRKTLDSFDAYELVLRGRFLMHDKTRESLMRARELFEAATRLDPGFALAHTQLAISHLHEFFFDDTGSALTTASDIASRAMKIDEEEPWCHMILGLAHLHKRRFDLAVRYCERAATLNPNDPKLVSKFALVLVDVGRPLEAIPLIERAMRLSPLHPEDYSGYLALAHYGARRYAEARDALLNAPDTTFYFHVWMAAINYRLGLQDDAVTNCSKAMMLAPTFSISRFAAMEPIRDPEDLAHWTTALRGAGFA